MAHKNSTGDIRENAAICCSLHQRNKRTFRQRTGLVLNPQQRLFTTTNTIAWTQDTQQMGAKSQRPCPPLASAAAGMVRAGAAAATRAGVERAATPDGLGGGRRRIHAWKRRNWPEVHRRARTPADARENRRRHRSGSPRDCRGLEPSARSGACRCERTLPLRSRRWGMGRGYAATRKRLRQETPAAPVGVQCSAGRQAKRGDGGGGGG